MILISDPRVAAVPVHDTGEAMIDLRTVAELRVDLRLADPAGAYAQLACFTAAAHIPAPARRNRFVLGSALRGAGFANYPTEWWHWSYGDRYWALGAGATQTRYGPVDLS